MLGFDARDGCSWFGKVLRGVDRVREVPIGIDIYRHRPTPLGTYTNSTIADTELNNGIFEKCQIRLCCHDSLHTCGVFLFGALAACGPDGGTAASIEDFRLERGGIGITSHFAAESIQFVDEVAFGKPANRGIAGHAGKGVNTRGNQESWDAHPCGGECGFSTGMSATDNNQVKG